MLNEILGIGARWQQLLTRKFGILGGAPSPQLTPEISPHFDMQSDPENRILIGDLLVTGFMSVAAVAVKKSVIQLHNPTGSNLLVVLELARYGNIGGSSSLRLGIVQSGALALTNSSNFARDTRRPVVGGTPFPGAARLTGDNDPAAVAVGNLQFDASVAAGVMVSYEKPVVINPGFAIQVVQETVNLTLDANFAWRETPMAPGEVGPF